MIAANFENLNLQVDEKIIITNLGGSKLHGYYKNKYSRAALSFDFLNLNGSKIETISLKTIQNIHRA